MWILHLLRFDLSLRGKREIIMKYKRLLSLLLAVVMILGMLSGCGNNQAEQTNPIQETPATENTSEIINRLDIPDLWKQELHHAMELGLLMDKIQQETISGKEMMELLDWFVNYAAAEKTDSWKEEFPTIRESNAQLSRFDAMTALFLAAEHVGGVYAGHNYGTMELSEGINHNWDTDMSHGICLADLRHTGNTAVVRLARVIWMVPPTITILVVHPISAANIRSRWTRI